MSKPKPGGTVTARGGRRKGPSPRVFTMEAILMKSQRSEELPMAGAVNLGRAGGNLKPLHGCSRMGSHSNVNHKMKFSLFTRKTPERTPGSYFLAKPAFSGIKKKFLGINQQSLKRCSASTCHPSCAEPGDHHTAWPCSGVVEHPSPGSRGALRAWQSPNLHHLQLQFSSPARRIRLHNTAAAPQPHTNPAQSLLRSHLCRTHHGVRLLRISCRRAARGKDHMLGAGTSIGNP